MRYTFGTSQAAADRLNKIAEFFNPLAKDFIKQFVHRQIKIALDLGCGPGFTTHMLKQATNSKDTYGLDLSNSFLKLARKQYPEYTFLKHNVTVVPFPVNADIIYTRFLLSHLNKIVTTIDNWAGELNEDGILCIEEVEDIFTDITVFKEYLEANKGLIANQGAKLYIGKTLGNARYKNKVIYNKSVLLPVSNYQAASWFYPNTINIWKKEKFIKKLFNKNKRNAISIKLKNIMMNKNNNSDITWKMRRIVLLGSVLK